MELINLYNSLARSERQYSGPVGRVARFGLLIKQYCTNGEYLLILRERDF